MEREETGTSNGYQVKRKPPTLSDPIKRYVETMWSHSKEAAVFRQREKGHTQTVCPCSKCRALPEWCWILLHQECDPVHTGNPASLAFGFNSFYLLPQSCSIFSSNFQTWPLHPENQYELDTCLSGFSVSCSALLTDHRTSAQTLVMRGVTDWAGICFRKWPAICFKAMQFPLFSHWNHNG